MEHYFSPVESARGKEIRTCVWQVHKQLKGQVDTELAISRCYRELKFFLFDTPVCYFVEPDLEPCYPGVLPDDRTFMIDGPVIQSIVDKYKIKFSIPDLKAVLLKIKYNVVLK